MWNEFLTQLCIEVSLTDDTRPVSLRFCRAFTIMRRIMNRSNFQ